MVFFKVWIFFVKDVIVFFGFFVICLEVVLFVVLKCLMVLIVCVIDILKGVLVCKRFIEGGVFDLVICWYIIMSCWRLFFCMFMYI